MITLITLCDLFWLLWALPLLALLWLWWRSNKKYDNMVSDYEGRIKGLNSRIGGMETDLSACAKSKADLEGDVAITKGRLREMEADMKSLKAKAQSNKAKADATHTSSKPSGDEKVKSDDSNSGQIAKPAVESKSSDLGVVSSLAGSSGSSSLAGDAGSSSLAGSSGSSSLAGDAGSSGSSDIVESGSKADAGSSAVSGGSKKKSIYSGVKNDNLQIIEGIGPKMESVLKENGVSTFADLADQNPDSLRAILAKYGDKYTKIIDPTTWAQQASYGAKGDFDGLIDLQKKLDAGRDNAASVTDSKLEKYLVKTGALKAFKQDDLKAIEGIGPATEKLLHGKGIKTWRELANTNASTLKGILTEAGSRFALGDPTTWPKQAELAADGEFDKLREYQDFLDGGRG